MVLAVFRKVCDAGCYGVARILDGDNLTAFADFAAVQDIRPENGAHHFGSPGPHKTGKPDDFAGPHVKTDVLKGTLTRQARRAEHHLAEVLVTRREQLCDRPTDHQA